MALLKDSDPRFRRLERKVGVFVLVAIAGLVATVVGVGIKKELFTKKTHLYFMSATGQELHEDMAVKLSGFAIGKVDKLELTEAAKVKVFLQINAEYMKWVKTDSIAKLGKEGVIGASFIDVSVGSDSAKELVNGAEITFEAERGLGTVVEQISAQIHPLVEDIRRLLKTTDTLIAGLPATQKKLDEVLSSTAANLRNVEKITANEAPAAARSAREAIESTKKVVDSVGKTWPINRNIAPAKSETLPADSFSSPPNPGTAPKP